MRTILFIVRKEFLQIFRHKVMLPLIFLMPIIQLVILAHAADFEVKNINLHIVDQDRSQASVQLIGKFGACRNFNLVGYSFTNQPAFDEIQSGDADLFLEIPPNFQRDLIRHNAASLQISVNAINGVQAGLANAYANAIIQDFNRQIRTEWARSPVLKAPAGLSVTYSNWFNPDMNYQTFMVPGILVLLVTLIGMFLSGMNIVKEKEIGTIEQINVTPIRKYQFIIGKLLPFWIIALVELSIGLAVGWLIFDIPFVGSLWLIFGFAAIYLLVVLGLGLLVSTITETQQQAMFVSWFFLIIFILMSGLFTPIESMPAWAQAITRFNPVAYFVDVMRLVLLKGSNLMDIRLHVAVMLTAALLVNTLAVVNYRKTN
ncbi:MAG: ABC transporter permease [Phaeodactylibacter sp.]|nr:ABC transporter permease [Phaeodactylibacter sp.]